MSEITDTRVRCEDGRLVMEALRNDQAQGWQVEGWLELPVMLKQPLMALVGKVAHGKHAELDYPVPGGDTLVVRQGEGGALRLSRTPAGFPPQGRDLSVPHAGVERFLAQVKGI